MSFLSSLFIILFCLSIHLCSARHLEVFFHKNSALKIPFSSKDSAVEWKTDGDSILRKSHTGTIPHKANEDKHVGSGILGSSSHMGLLNSAKIEGSRRQLRSILERSSVVDDETMDFHNSDPQYAIDYDPPSSTPPIHNDQIYYFD